MEDGGVEAGMAARLRKLLAEGLIYVERVLPYTAGGILQQIREQGQLLSEEYTGEGIAVKARVPMQLYGRLI